MNGTPLTKEQLDWAWNKWQEGYSQKDIARVLNKNKATIMRAFGRMLDNGFELNRNGRKRQNGENLKWE